MDDQTFARIIQQNQERDDILARIPNPPAYDAAIAYATKLGTEHGRNAASWYFDGNTPKDTYARVLRGIEDGDPEILDTLPAPDLSGQWADSLTGPQLVEDALLEAGMTRADILAMTDYDGAFSAICDAYDFAFSDAARDEIESAARWVVGGAR